MTNSYIEALNECIKSGNDYKLSLPDCQPTFEYALQLIKTYFTRLLPLAVDCSCELEIENKKDSIFGQHRTSFSMVYRDFDENISYAFGIAKMIETSSWTESVSCKFIMGTVNHKNDEVIDRCVIFAFPNRKKKYVHSPKIYVDRLLKSLYASLTDREKCYLLLADPSAENFFQLGEEYD